MTLLNTLYKLVRGSAKTTEEPKNENEPDLRASVLIGIDKKQQYFFDVKWDYTDPDKTANDLANLMLGLTYGLFTGQIKNLLLNNNDVENPYDQAILAQTAKILTERSDILNTILNNDDDPIVKPSEVFRPPTDVNKNS